MKMPLGDTVQINIFLESGGYGLSIIRRLRFKKDSDIPYIIYKKRKMDVIRDYLGNKGCYVVWKMN
jgi:hypothetical protein